MPCLLSEAGSSLTSVSRWNDGRKRCMEQRAQADKKGLWCGVVVFCPVDWCFWLRGGAEWPRIQPLPIGNPIARWKTEVCYEEALTNVLDGGSTAAASRCSGPTAPWAPVAALPSLHHRFMGVYGRTRSSGVHTNSMTATTMLPQPVR